eukprot:scaffold21569_cov107-Isochrysis_galbana.AAC.12
MRAQGLCVWARCALVVGQSQPLCGDVVDHGVRLLARDVVAGDDHVQLGQPLAPHDRVDHTLKPPACGRGTDADLFSAAGGRRPGQ